MDEESKITSTFNDEIRFIFMVKEYTNFLSTSAILTATEPLIELHNWGQLRMKMSDGDFLLKILTRGKIFEGFKMKILMLVNL